MMDWEIFLAQSSAAGLLSAAVVQLLKDGTGLRRCCNKRWLEQWWNFTHRTPSETSASNKCRSKQLCDDKLAALVDLASGGENSRNALYELPAEKMAARLKTAWYVALVVPEHDRGLANLLPQPEKAISPTTKTALDELRNAKVVSPASKKLLLKWAAGAQDKLTAQSDQVQKLAIEARLGALELQACRKWKRLLHCIALLISILVIAVANRQTICSNLDKTLEVVAMAIAGGVLAPVAKDIGTAIEGLRGRASRL